MPKTILENKFNDNTKKTTYVNLNNITLSAEIQETLIQLIYEKNSKEIGKIIVENPSIDF